MLIGELAEKTGTTQKAIRYYESQGLLKADRSESGYRTFDARAVEIVGAIKAGQKLRLQLRELRSVLEHVQQGLKPCCELRVLIARQRSEIRRQMEELSRFDTFLKDLQDIESTSDDQECPILMRIGASS